MTSFAIQNFMEPLLTEGMIDGAITPTLFDDLNNRQTEIRDALRLLSRTMIVDRDLRVAVVTVIPEEELDLRAEEEDLYPIPQIDNRARLSYFESAVAVHFKRELERESPGGSGAVWHSKDNLLTGLSPYLPVSTQNDAIRAEARLDTILSKLRGFNLVEEDTVAGVRSYRGTKYLSLILRIEELEEFERLAERCLEAQEALNKGAADEEATETKDLFNV